MAQNRPGRRVLIVDDDPLVLDSISLMLRSSGFLNVVTCLDPRQVSTLLEDDVYSCMILDLTMPHKNGEEVLQETVDAHPGIPVLILTSSIDIDTAVRCMKSGAMDFITKPVETEKLLAAVNNLVRLNELEQENRSLRERILDPGGPSPDLFSAIITVDEQMRAIFRYIESVAPTPHPFLITGETGTGKELFARTIHDASGREGRFITVNAAGLDDTMFTDCLFGHRKGAFTGADSSRQGLIREASGGTIFLDEIGDLALSSQTKLLRLLQSGEYYPLGSDLCMRSDARVIAATNRNLDEALRTGAFRRDLFYRLYTHRIDIPPLRKRKCDIPVLLDHFITAASSTLEKKSPSYPAELPLMFCMYDFPGNVRELESIVFDVIATHGNGMLSLEEFRRRMPSLYEIEISDGACAGETLTINGDRFPTIRDAESILIRKAMEKSRGNQGIAASLLGISRQTLNGKLKAMEYD